MPIEPETKERWLREFHLNGFAVLRAFLPVDLVREMHDQIVPILHGELERKRREDPVLGRGEERLALDISRYADLLGGAIASPHFRRNPAIEEMADALLGAGCWERGWSNCEAAFPGSRHMSWHTDQKMEETPDPGGPHETVRLTFNIPLVDFTEENGATEVLPGSHRLPRSFLDFPIESLSNLYPVRWDLRRGDAVLRDGNMLHRGTPNRSDRVRPMLDQTYKKPVRPVQEDPRR